MSLTKQGLASAIKDKTNNIADPQQAIDALWSAICDYFESNAEVNYGWSAVNPTGSPDPEVMWTGSIKTSGSLTLTNADTPESALSSFSSMLNTQIATWVVEPPTGYSLTPMFIIPTVNLGISKADDRDSALEAFAGYIIEGVVQATLSTAGTHGAYTGTGTFTNIV